MNQHALLIINSGSSSIKFQVFTHTKELQLLAYGKVSNLGTTPTFRAINEALQKKKIIQTLEKEYNHEQAISLILDWIHRQEQNWSLKAVAHRVVHGGTLFTKSVLITADIIKQLKQFNVLAPLHQPHNIAAIEIIKKMHPHLPQIACFDTAFHAHHQPLFTTYALPQNIRDQGIRRYGFHGLSYEWITHTLENEHPNLATGRIIAAHLGNGASLCAIDNGISIDTTMGLTALDGLPMGTRSGSVDPGAIIYMIRDLGLSPDEVEQILYNNSGLLGLSGQTNDVQQLLEQKEFKAQFALDYFCFKTAQFIGMMAISLGGVDGIVFTGGIGENSSLIRESILNKIKCLRPFTDLVIPANEEKMMAIHSLTLCIYSPQI
jgi:acetate kinase